MIQMVSYVKVRETKNFVVYVTKSDMVADFNQKLHIPKGSPLVQYEKIRLKGVIDEDEQD